MDDLRRKDEEVISLKQKMKQRQSSNSQHSELLESKEQVVVDLQERLEKTLALNNRLDQGTKKHEENIRNLEKSLQEVETDLERSTSECNSKDRLIERNKMKVNELQGQLAAKNEEILDIEKR